MGKQRIAMAPDLGVVAVIQSLLRSEGISVADTDLGGHVSVAGADQQYSIDVLSEDVDRARNLLQKESFGKYLTVPVSDSVTNRSEQDQRNWVWGHIYYGRSDPRLFVRKNFEGAGWTVNFAHPVSYLFLAVLVGFIIWISIAYS